MLSQAVARCFLGIFFLLTKTVLQTYDYETVLIMELVPI